MFLAVLLLDVNTRKFVGNLIGHNNKISAVCFNKHESMANVSCNTNESLEGERNRKEIKRMKKGRVKNGGFFFFFDF
jgi:hypothetical protein